MIFDEVSRDEVSKVANALEAEPNRILATDELGQTLAFAAPTIRMLEYLVRYGLDLDAPRDDGWTILHLLAWRDDVNKADACLRLGANPNVTLPLPDGATPLHLAATDGNAQIARILLLRGANPNIADGFEATSLHDAALSG